MRACVCVRVCVYLCTWQAVFEGEGAIDLPAAREKLQERREALSKEQVRVSGMLNTFQRVARLYQPAK